MLQRLIISIAIFCVAECYAAAPWVGVIEGFAWDKSNAVCNAHTFSNPPTIHGEY